MPAYIEFDKTNKKIRRIITADEAPVPVAYLSYQEIPDGLEIDLNDSFEDIMKAILEHHQSVDLIPVQTPVQIQSKPDKFVEV